MMETMFNLLQKLPSVIVTEGVGIDRYGNMIADETLEFEFRIVKDDDELLSMGYYLVDADFDSWINFFGTDGDTLVLVESIDSEDKMIKAVEAIKAFMILFGDRLHF